MRRLAAGIVAGLLLLSITGSASRASTDEELIIHGVGAAHGFGMAMDGVLGQARSGWGYDRILSLFYPGTEVGRADGTIRVGLAEGSQQSILLPGGGTLSANAEGTSSMPLGDGTRVTLTASGAGIEVSTADELVAEPAALRPSQDPGQDPGLDLLPTPSPPPIPLPAPEPDPSQPESPEPPPQTPSGSEPGPSSVWLRGSGDPALVLVESTGRRYRGAIEVRNRDGVLVVINHVDLETYVAGIAEEKGQGWPLEGLKALAVAARSLGAATMSWYQKNQPRGYDICPTGACQLYLGYDGEEPAMRQATRETAGEIRTYGGRPILAMYHGNGGGQTESYRAAIANGTDPHPYLRSVRYPFANPRPWERRATRAGLDSSLREAGVAVPGRLVGVEVTERGESPRARRVRVVGSAGEIEIPGTRFAAALELPSTWFHIGTSDGPATATVSIEKGIKAGRAVRSSGTDPVAEAGNSLLPLGVALLSVLALAVAARSGPFRRRRDAVPGS